MDMRNISSTFLKGIDVLRCFKDGKTNLTMADIAKELGFDRATVRRLCLTLVEAGLLLQSDRKFRLSPAVMTFAGSFLQANNFGSMVQPLLNRVSLDIGGEVSLAVLDHDEVLYLAQSATKDARISLGLTIGSTLPVIPTATGRMLLACLSLTHRRAILDRLHPNKYTPLTLSDKADIAAQIEQAEQQGFCAVNGEYEPGICALSVPISGVYSRQADSSSSENASGIGQRLPAVLGTTLPLNVPQFETKREATLASLQIAASRLNQLHLFS